MNILRRIIPKFLISWYHYTLAFLGVIIYGFPSNKIIVIGITGTKGKSTVVNLAGQILEHAGFKIGWISSATLKIGEKEWLNPFHMTMPGRFFIQNFLRKMVNEKCKYCLLEVTSEGILQHRHRFINFNTAVFTNLSPEHIEAHKGFENYRNEKLKLFKSVKNIHIINIDDENSAYFLRFPAKQKLGYSLNSKDKLPDSSNIRLIEANNINYSNKGIDFSVNDVDLSLSLLGKFNIYNSLAAISIALSQGVDLETCKKALKKINVIPGRMEVINEGQAFTVIVDLAHTPDSFEKIFESIKDFSYNKVISVFGSAGGLRDKWKRPILGEIAAKHSDKIIITNEDSYDEDPNEILKSIEQGILKNKDINYEKVLDRREAIRKAFSLAKENDIVLILGKGTEQKMVIGSKKISWDDRIVAKEELQKYKKLEV